MNRLLCALLLIGSSPAIAGSPPDAIQPAETAEVGHFRPDVVETRGAVRIGNQSIAYRAYAGTIVVHAKDWDETGNTEEPKDAKAAKPQASMFYAAYFKDGAPAAGRPITFLFNGGPGSPSMYLHMSAFGPVRVQTADARHTPAAPYNLVENAFSLLNVSDLVFIDAPGTGFSRIVGKDKEKAFYGVDQDVHAFGEFILDFLSRYKRWNSPKYLLGESYGTMRGAALSLDLQHRGIDLNGLILLSTILNWDTLPDDPQLNPAIDTPYVVSLPTYAATAWYHRRLADRPDQLRPFLDEVERFATGEYAQALIQGNALPEADRRRIAETMSRYTGLPVSYLLKTNLRIEYGAFQKELLADGELTTGTLDTRFLGPTIDPLAKIAGSDPSGDAIDAAIVAAFNSYSRGTLNYGETRKYETQLDVYRSWDYRHQPPGADRPLIALPNVLPDLAVAMKGNPHLKVLVLGGYFDVSTPYFEGRYELRHLPIPPSLQGNIDFRYYHAGHMPYLNPEVIGPLHSDVTRFIRETDRLP